MSRLTLKIEGEARDGLDELRRLTDAEDDASAIRNALRLHLALLRAYRGGTEILMRARGSTVLEAADLFAASSSKPHLTVVK